METKEKKRGVGRPREHPAPLMLTIRTNPTLYKRMMSEIERQDSTQRAFIEDAVERELRRQARLRADRKRRR